MKKATQSSAYTTLLASISLEHHILAECLAMAKHAFSSGLPVPGRLTERLDAIAAIELGQAQSTDTRDMSSTENAGDPNEMFKNDQRGDNSKELAKIHWCLSEIVKPATPGTILLMATETAKAGVWRFLGPVRLIRGMTSVAVICLVAFVGISTTSYVNTVSIAKSIFENQGIDLLLNLLFLMTAAGLGACFAALFQANRYIAEGTFDPKYESSYWIRFVLGLMAGLMLTQLIPMPEGVKVIPMPEGVKEATEDVVARDAALNAVGEAAKAVRDVTTAGAKAAVKAAKDATKTAVENLSKGEKGPDVVAAGAQAAADIVKAVKDAPKQIRIGESGASAAVFARPTLAMLGGFSAALVYRILNRLIEAVESLVRGETREIVAAQEQAAEARFAEQSAQSRMQLAGSLTKLQQQVAGNAKPEELQEELNRLLGRLVPADEGEEEMESGPPPQTQA